VSLDVYLTLPGDPLPVASRFGIYVRLCGKTVEVTREQWDELYPGVEPALALIEGDGREVFTENITHNLGTMARECGLYEPLWRPDESGIERAAQLVEPLARGLDRLRAERERLEQFNPPNGWGDYELHVRFTEKYLAACRLWPEAEVRASR
jgi:hypothetical protein